MLKSLLKSSTILFAFLLSAIGVFAQDAANGEKVFKQNCTACHSLTDKELAAPGLGGVAERWAGNEEMLYTWIQNPNKAIESGNPYVTGLMSKYKSKFGTMSAQAVTKDEIDDIMAYIAAYVPPAPKEEVAEVSGTGSKVETGLPSYFWVILAVLFGIVLWLLSGVRKQLGHALSEKEGREHVELGAKASAFNWMSQHKIITSLVGIFVVMFLTVQAWNAAATIGIYEGYMPEQPIAFSHKLHVTGNKIDCQYCHSTAEKSKTPTIPSTNVCMNCHKYVKEGPKHGTTEIDKIYKAIGWDKENYTYSGVTDPVKWIKVHDLPDHVYFNHSQHVKVGKIACQECHGAVEEMEVIRQEKPLTMEWCISCHNKTEVQMAGNGYYDEISKRLRDNEQGEELLREYLEDGKITVKELGGWECSKCHY